MKWLVRAGWVVAGVLGLWAVAWLGVPPLLKWQAQKQLGALLGRTVTIEAVQFRPWALELQVDRLVVAAADPASAPTLSVDRVRANATLSSILRLAPVLEAVEVDAPVARVVHLGDGRYDFDDVVARLAPAPGAPKPPDEAPARFALYNLQVRGGAVDFDDRPVGVHHEVRDLHLSLPFLSSLPSDVDIRVEPRLAFKVNGAPFDTGAESTPFARDRATELALNVGRVDLKPYLPYLPASLPVRLRGAAVSATLSLQLAAPAGQVPTVKVRGQANVDDVDVADRDGRPLAAWRHLGVVLRDVEPFARRVDLERVVLEAPHLVASRDAQGTLNLARLAAPSGAPAPAAPASAASGAASSAGGGWTASVGTLEVTGATLDWSDATTQPAAALGLDDAALTLTGVQWPSADPWPLKARAQLRGTEAVLDVDGHVHERRAQVKVGIDKLDLAPFAPYLAGVLKPRVEGRADAAVQLDWAADAPAPGVRVAVERAAVGGLRLLPESGRGEPLASLQRLELAGVAVDAAARQLDVASLRIVQPAIELQRARSGELNVMQWAVAPASGAPGAAPVDKAEPPAASWRLRLADLAVQGAQLGWTDEVPVRPVRVRIDELALGVKGLEWAGDQVVAPAQVQLAARVLRAAAPGRRAAAVVPGRIEWRGQAGAVPLQAKGTLKVDKLGLEMFRSYVAEHINVDIVRAMVDFRGDVSLQMPAPGSRAAAGPTATVRGDAGLADLRVVSRLPPGSVAAPDELLTWQSLALKGVNVAVAPNAKPRLSVDSATLSDFYSRLVITEQGRFNLQDVAGTPPAPDAAASAPAAPAAASAPPPAAASAPLPAPGAGLPVVIAIGGITLVNGRVDFTDRFIRPNYSAALSELNGRLGAFRSDTREMATLELRGKAAGTAQLDISGSVNPTANPLALDIKARATDLELAPLSPYAGKYAGYAIERGKLSMDVAYKIDPDGKLDARNQIILNQLTFGEKIDSPDATKLPVLFAVSLLKDRDGNIDLDLPISGSINDPQFSVFRLVLKVIGNLIVKAVTAPFSLFAGGGGEDLSMVEFRPGSAVPAASAGAVVEKVSKALTDRPALKLTVTGSADAVAERAAMQQQALEQRLRAEWRRDGGSDDPAAEIPADERLRILRSVYRRTDMPDKPRNVLGIQKELPAAEMESMLLTRTQVGEDTARELALQRGVAVRDALIARGLPSERIFLAAPRLRGGAEGEGAPGPSAKLSLSVN